MNQPVSEPVIEKLYFAIKKLILNEEEPYEKIIGITESETYAQSMEDEYCTYEEVKMLPKQ